MILEAVLCGIAMVVGIVWCWWLGLVIVAVAVAAGAVAFTRAEAARKPQ